MNTTNDWQTSCAKIKHRGAYLFKHGTWLDCRFLVGSESNQQLVSGHKLLLAMASPVFDAMFNGTLPEKMTRFRFWTYSLKRSLPLWSECKIFEPHEKLIMYSRLLY